MSTSAVVSVGRSVTPRGPGRRAAWEDGDRGIGGATVRRWRRGPVRAMFTTYALIIVLGLAYFIVLGVANR
jgi:hypothetical protein